MLIYRRAHAASCARHAGAVLPIIVGVAALVFLSRLLADAAGFPPAAALKLLGFTLLQYAPQFLTVSVAAGVCLALARAFNEMEMDAWFSLGLGLRHFVFPALLFALPVALLTAALSLGGSPWAARAGDEFRAALSRSIAPENLRPGVFGRDRDGNAYFIEAEGGEISGVFLARRKGDLHEVILSGGIRRAPDGGVRLESGRLYRVPQLSGDAEDDFAPADRAEIVWRVNMPLSVLLLALCAPLLTRGRPRGRTGRGHGFAAALLLFSFHLNLLYFARDMVADEIVPGWLGMIFPHLTAGGAALVLGLPALLRR